MEKCDVYDLTIYSDGSLMYNGNKNVEMIGVFSSKLSNDNLALLQDLLKRNEFALLQDSYLSGARDLQKIRVKYEGKELLFHKRKAPESVLNILEHIEGLVSEQKWDEIIKE